MKNKTRRITISIVILVVLVCLMYLLLRHPRAYSIIGDVDINSGDVRTQKYVCLVRIKNEINTTRFSREVRRLGIEIPEDHLWERIRTEEGLVSKKINYRYADALTDCIQATLAFEINNVPDEKRKVILKEMLENLRDGKLNEIKEQLKALKDKSDSTDDSQDIL